MRILCFGEILLRLSPPNAYRFVQARLFDAVYGGSEANVAVSLAQWGEQVSFLTRVPDNELGQAALGALAQQGVDISHCKRGGERLGIYFLEQGIGRRASKVLYDRAHSGMADLKPGMLDWQSALEQADWLHWSGITPALSQGAAQTLMEGLEIAKKLDVKVSCDLNYRASLWKYGASPASVMPELVGFADVLLGDRKSFLTCLGINSTKETSPDTLLAMVGKTFPRLRFIAMTRRDGISASHNTYQGLLHDGLQLRMSQSYDLPDMLDRIGGGDAFMAGLIHGLRKMSDDTQQIVEFATAAAAFKHYVAGDFNLCDEVEVRDLMAGNTGGKVNR
ncbi:MAG: sugar kinase [Saprospiraceae bacterium]|nr:sugar kinase [Saprospiraceae bacterium]